MLKCTQIHTTHPHPHKDTPHTHMYMHVYTHTPTPTQRHPPPHTHMYMHVYTHTTTHTQMYNMLCGCAVIISEILISHPQCSLTPGGISVHVHPTFLSPGAIWSESEKCHQGWYLSERSPLVMIAVCCDLLVCTYVCIIANPSRITNCCVCPDLYVFALVNAYPLPCLSLDKAVHCVQTPMWLWSMPQNTQLHLWAHCRGHVWLQHSCTGPHCWTLQARHCVRLVPQRGECGSWDSV